MTAAQGSDATDQAVSEQLPTAQLLTAQREQLLTDQVVASFRDAESPRYREVMASLVTHLHAFIRDVRLTQAEWDTAIDFLTRAGHITDAKRQEFILLSDVLGASMMTVGVNSPPVPDATESTVFGPFFVENAPLVKNGDDISGRLEGRPCHVFGRVVAVGGEPIPNARVEVWAADDDGFYDVQYEGDTLAGRAHLFTDDDGRYDFWTVQPAPYPIPFDGPVGDLLAAASRSPMRPAHVHFMVTHDGFQPLITHIFVAGGDWLDSDAVFGVKQSLIVDFVEHPSSEAPASHPVDGMWSEAEFTIVLAKSTSEDAL
jgi:hydroxyquinol 1,2-dioxygenase